MATMLALAGLLGVPQWGTVWTRRGPGAVVARVMIAFAALGLFASACSSSSASWCDDAAAVAGAVRDFNSFVEFPEPRVLQTLFRDAMDAHEDATDGADEADRDAFAVLGVAVVNAERTLSAYDFDLLRTQSEADSIEQEELVALEGIPVMNALVRAEAAWSRRCADAG